MSQLFESILQEEALNEKALFGSMESQMKKASAEIEKQIKEFDAIIPKIKASSEGLSQQFGGASVFNQPIINFSSEALKNIALAKSSAELVVGLECVKKELEEAQKIITDESYIQFVKEIDNNTGIFGGDKGKLSIKDENGNEQGLTSKSAGKIVDKNQKGNFDAQKAHKEAMNEAVLNEFLGFGKKEKSQPVDVTKGFEKFKQSSQKLSQALANAGQITELLQKDPEMQKAAQAANVNFNKVAGILAVSGGILKVAGNFVPGLGAVGTMLASGAVLAKSGKSIASTVSNKNLSFGQKILRIAPAAAAAGFAVMGMKNAVGSLSAPTEAAPTPDGETQQPAETPQQQEEIKPTVNNSLEAQANAKPGDVLERADGTKVVLNKGDIEWAKNKLNATPPQQEPQIEQAPVEQVPDNPVNTEPAVEQNQEPTSASINEPSQEQVHNAMKNGVYGAASVEGQITHEGTFNFNNVKGHPADINKAKNILQGLNVKVKDPNSMNTWANSTYEKLPSGIYLLTRSDGMQFVSYGGEGGCSYVDGDVANILKQVTLDRVGQPRTVNYTGYLGPNGVSVATH